MMNCLRYRHIAGVLLFVAICQGIPADPPKYDTIVVGLGAAGTTAASTLARAGRKVLALEAQDRVGGRVYTVPFGDGIVEVGAEWIHGTEESRVYQTATDNNITTLVQDFTYYILNPDGTPAGTTFNDIIKYIYEDYEETSDKPEPFRDYMTRILTECIKNKAPQVYADKKYLQRVIDFIIKLEVGDWGAWSADDLNAGSSYVGIGGPLTTSWHTHGYKTFIELMLNKYKGGPGLPTLTIKLNAEVTKIEWPKEADGLVSVTTKDGTVYKAKNVIVTVSVAVLKEKYKSLFTPPLPQKKITAIEKIQMGLIGKIIFSFPNAWWPSKEYMYGFFWDSDDSEIKDDDKWTTQLVGTTPPMGSSNTLTIWTSGDVAKQVETMPEETVKEKAMGILRKFMGANVTVPEPTGMLRSKWFSNEFTRGTYSYDRMSGADVPTARADLAEPLVDAAGNPRVLFAGEASHSTRFATVHGASDTGHREAMRLLGTQT